MSWVELHDHFVVRPKTIRLAAKLSVPRFHVTGILPEIWCSVLLHSPEDGLISREDLETCLVAAGWPYDDVDRVIKLLVIEHLDEPSKDVFCVRNWDEYAGRLMDLRKKWKHQKATQRAKNKPSEMSGRSPRGVRPQQNKTKQDNTELQTEDIDGITFAKAWLLYPLKKGKAASKRKWAQMSTEDRQQAYDALVLFAKQYENKSTQYCPHGSSWFNGERWKDEDASVDKEGGTHEQVGLDFGEQPKFG